jgi:tetratricopeptide (TPR) repeat protein
VVTDPREHALRTLLVEAVRVLVPDLTELERLIGRVSPAAWAELPRQVGYRQAIELVVKHAIEKEWNDALVGELERIAPRNDVVVDLRALLAPDTQPYRGDTVTGLGRSLEDWRPRIEHALQPALHFKGRRALLASLEDWLAEPSPATHVVSLIAVGGAGKTAIVERLVAGLCHARLAGGLFVWSFYENNRTEEFLQRACEYFAGRVLDDALGRLHHLQQTLEDGRPHVLVLDGIELVQEARDGGAQRPRGSLTDPLLKRLLRAVAAGLGNARAIITSRFPLPDLRDWEDDRRHRAESLDALDAEAAVAVFEAWGVRGARDALVEMASHCGFHALSVSVLAAYLGEVAGGDPRAAARFDLGAASAGDPLAAKLSRVLTAYAAALTTGERRALAVLSTLPRGVDSETLDVLSARTALRDVEGIINLVARDARALGRRNDRNGGAHAMEAHLERLRRTGLVFAYREPARPTAPSRLLYTAHPFVRDFFKHLVDVEEVNRTLAELVRPSVTHRPGGGAASRAELDRAEELIEHLVLAGKRRSAYDTYLVTLGGYAHLAALQEYVRGRRILEQIVGGRLAGQGELDAARLNRLALDTPDLYALLRELGHYALAMGELDHAEQLYDRAREIFVLETQTIDGLLDEAADFGWLYLQRGALPRARMPLPLVSAPVDLTDLLDLLQAGGGVHQELAAVVPAPGVLAALYDVLPRRSRRLTGAPGHEHALVRGYRAVATDPAAARAELVAFRDAISTSGQPRLVLAGTHLAAWLAHATGDRATALHEASRGAELADACGFGLLAIDFRVLWAHCLIAAGDVARADRLIDEAIERASDPRCDYRWGAADAWHQRALCRRDTDPIAARLAAAKAVRLRGCALQRACAPA